MSLLSGARGRAVAAALCIALTVCGVVTAQRAMRWPVQQRIDAGVALVKAGKPIPAEREWREAAALAPNDPLLWRLLGELYLETERWRDGLEAFQKLERLAPDTPYLYARLATCALRTGEEIQAADYAKEALRRRPDDDAALAILAFVSEMQDDSDRQIEYLTRLLKNSPNDVEFLQSLIKAYQRKGQYAEIRPLAQRLRNLRPDDPVSSAMEAMALFETDSSPDALKQAEALLNRSLTLNPQYPFARYYLGRVFLRQGRSAEAVTQLEAARILNPREMKTVFELANAYRRSGRADLAAAARRDFEEMREATTRMSVLQKRCALDRNDFESHLTLGELTLQSRDFRQAGYYLARAVALRPDNTRARAAYQRMQNQLRTRAADNDRSAAGERP